MHKAKVILDAFYTRLEIPKNNGTIRQLLRTNSGIAVEYPAVVVSMGGEEVLMNGSSFIDSRLTISTDIFVKSNVPDLDGETLKVRLAIHKALMALDNTLGLPFVFSIKFSGQDEPNINPEGVDYGSATRLSWTVDYRTNLTDPSQ